MEERCATWHGPDGILRNMLTPPTPRMFWRVAARALLAVLAVTGTGCSSRFFQLSPRAERVERVSGVGVPSQTPAAGPVALPAQGAPALVDTILPEPDPAPSDSAGVARLRTLIQLWHLVSLYHPAVIERGAPWDSAFIRAATMVRTASDPTQLASVYRRLLFVLQDPLTRVELDAATRPTGVASEYRLSSERTRDSVLLVRLPLGADQRALWTDSAAAAVQQQLASAPSRIILDLRGSGVVAVAEADAMAALVDRFANAAAVATLLSHTVTSGSAVRTRRVGGARYRDGEWHPDDAWMVRSDPSLFPRASSPKQVMVLANGATLFPRAVLALVANHRATLLAEEGVEETPLVPSVVLPIAEGVRVRIRTGELVHANGAVGLTADTVLPRAAPPLDTAPVLHTALSLLRTNRTVRATQTPTPRAPALLPRYYDADPYPFMGARLLAAARLWSAIRVRHVHRDFYDEDMDALMERTIPQLEAARSASEYAAALLPLVSALNDAPSSLRGASADTVRGMAATPFRVRYVEHRAVITEVVRDSLSSALGIDIGMEVTAADGFPMPAWIQDHRLAVSAPNEWTRLAALMPLVSRGPSGGALFRLRDLANRERQLNIPRRADYLVTSVMSERPNSSAVRMLPGDIAYFDVERIPPDSMAPMLARSRGARAWMVDLRGILHGDRADALLAAVRSVPEAVLAREVRRYEREPCTPLTIREARVQCAITRETGARVSRGDTAGHYTGYVVALIDERTAGQMERLAMALDAVTRVTFIGTSSAGAPGEVMEMALPGSLTVALPVVELRRSDDGQLQRVGITPSVEVPLTVRGVRSGFDDVIERAQQWVVQQLEPPARRRR